MPKLLYTWYFEKFPASVTSRGHSALRHEVSRICTILYMCMTLSLYVRHIAVMNRPSLIILHNLLFLLGLRLSVVL